MSDKHTFALFTHQQLPSAAAALSGQRFTLRDAEVWHQASHVLRLSPGDLVILFDGTSTMLLKLEALAKKEVIEGTIEHVAPAVPLQPTIHLYQGLLKKEAFEAVAYAAAQMGATTLTPVISKKIHRNWYTDNDNERLHKIMIAACQQAKQFILPTLQPAVTVEQLGNELAAKPGLKAYLFEPDGKPLFQALSAVHAAAQDTAYALILGPEGGFTHDERQALEQAGACCHALTPTILRSIEAAVVALGSFRSVGFDGRVADSKIL